MVSGFKTPGFTSKPLLAERFLLQQVSPYGRTLGIDVLECGGNRALTRMTANPRNIISTADQRPDPKAVIGLIDHSVGYAVAGLIEAETGLSTFDLRVDFANQQAAIGNLFTDTTILLKDKFSLSFQSITTDSQGAIIAAGSGLFRLGGFPGDAPPDVSLMGGHNPENCSGPFDEVVGLEGDPGALLLAADNPAIIGWEASNAIHGGAIGALLMAACQDRAESCGELASGKRLASLHMRFLRPGSGLKPLLSSSYVERQGRAASYVEARCFHEQDKDVATAEATFVQG